MVLEFPLESIPLESKAGKTEGRDKLRLVGGSQLLFAGSIDLSGHMLRNQSPAAPDTFSLHKR
jgi:hypothetical protein